MTASDERSLVVNADLDIEIGGQPVRFVADGSLLQLVTGDPGRLWAELAGSVRTLPAGSPSLRSTISTLSTRLDQVGLRAEFVGDDGPVMSIGRGCGSFLGRVLIGNSPAQFGSTRTVVTTVIGFARSATPWSARRRVFVASTSLVVTAAVAARRRRRIAARN